MLKLSPFVFVLLCLGCESPAPAIDEAAITASIAGQSQRFSQAYMDGDVETMVGLYTDDAVLFPGRSDVIRGTEAIRNYWTLPADRRITLHKMTPVEVEVSDSMASDYGYYEISGINGETAWGPTRGTYEAGRRWHLADETGHVEQHAGRVSREAQDCNLRPAATTRPSICSTSPTRSFL